MCGKLYKEEFKLTANKNSLLLTKIVYHQQTYVLQTKIVYC